MSKTPKFPRKFPRGHKKKIVNWVNAVLAPGLYTVQRGLIYQLIFQSKGGFSPDQNVVLLFSGYRRVVSKNAGLPILIKYNAEEENKRCFSF